jgi:predicted MFS family arabinose efflux permease
MKDASAAPDQVLTVFTPYQKWIAGLLAFLQFAVILDFMIMSPLGALIIPELKISSSQFGMVVSAYAFSAGISGLLTAGFADRFDRKRLLLFFFIGFIGGTLWCALAQSFASLLAARIVTGIFGGVIGSVVMAIAADLFAPQLRGRVMGVIQTAFAASQVLGIPVSLYLANRWSWHTPFFAMVAIGAAGALSVVARMRPVDAHLALPRESNAMLHLYRTLADSRHLTAFATTGLLTTGGFMLMPFSSVFVVKNLGIAIESLPSIYLITGLCTIFVGPLVGKLADRLGKLRVFMAGSAMTIVMVLVYTHLGPVSLPVLIGVNVLMFMGIFSRMIPYQALAASVPEPAQRGAFNSVGAALQQLAGGCSSLLAGHVVFLGVDGRLHGYDTVGYIVAITTVLAAVLASKVARDVALREGERALGV